MFAVAARSRRDAGEKRRTEKDLQEENGGAGVYSQGIFVYAYLVYETHTITSINQLTRLFPTTTDVRKLWDLKDPAWKYDIMPEIYNGQNVRVFYLIRSALTS